MILPYLRAGYPLLWLRTHEPWRTALTLARQLQHEAITPVWHDIVAGGRCLSHGNQPDIPADDPLAPIHWAMQQRETVLFSAGAHHFTDSLEFIQTVLNAVDPLKAQGSCLVFTGPVVKLPPELDRVVTVIDAPLPDREALAEVVTQTAEDASLDKPDAAQLDRLVNAAAGLTAFEAENALALSVVTTGGLDAQVVADQKARMIKQTGSLSAGRFQETFQDLGGLDALKDFCKRALRPESPVPAKGVLALGVPGTGKSAFAKALGNEVGRPVLCLDLGAIYGSLVGESESRVRAALAVVDAVAPCILFIDEIEKGLAGSGSAGRSDGGTSSRVFGTFLTWLNDHTSDVFVIATCNDVTALPPEFARAERWDGLFFVDLPGPEHKQRIWQIHGEAFGVNVSKPLTDDGWTGAEIKTCCRLAAMLDMPVSEAADHVVPVILTAKEAVEHLRQWADGRCLDATRGGRYRAKATTEPKPGDRPGKRRMRRGPKGPINPENN